MLPPLTLHLCRHGNTFSPGEPVVWVGRGQDLPLAPSGRAQAEDLAQTLKNEDVTPDLIYCSSLQRTRDFAFILQNHLAPACPVIAHSHLDELDYGQWGGLSSEEIADRFGQHVLDAWQKDALFPKADQGAWGDTESTIMRRIRDFLQDLAQDCQALPTPPRHVIIVSSNGFLRFFLHVVPGAFEDAKRKNTLKLPTAGRRVMHYDGRDFSMGG